MIVPHRVSCQWEIYFPLTANPVGYNHLLLAENVLWQFPETQLLVFILSNGKHPDPFKSVQIPHASLRYEILRSALLEWSDRENSLPARYADESKVLLKLGRNTVLFPGGNYHSGVRYVLLITFNIFQQIKKLL